ncbi:DinB family protein [Glycomyces xiaoerkulensis]|uniref:DinB family protein n=1 Tax=Glycomyces xiaoerkulensis TaxID=2038139 RepID=UPI000C26B921|nr:DinB family protein [Glycomyces xiaoerkulensis]
MNTSRVTAADVDLAVDVAVYLLQRAETDAWDYRAGPLKWTCWETVDHIADVLLAYAFQMGPRHPPLNRDVPVLVEPRRSGGPESALVADRSAGPPGLLQVLEAAAGLLSAVVRTAPEDVRAFHSMGIADPEGFAAMGVVEILVHTEDVSSGLDLAWRPPAELCERVLGRLFPDAPTGAEPWPTLLWATGRGSLPGHPRQAKWRWWAAPEGER